MALKLDPIRLLIADDVGIGKTIEAALIARELLDRGDVERFAVLCPPHLVEQWVAELEGRFHLRPVAVTASRRRAPRTKPATEREHFHNARTHRGQPRLHQERTTPEGSSCVRARSWSSSTKPTPARLPVRVGTNGMNCSRGLSARRRAIWSCSRLRRTAVTRRPISDSLGLLHPDFAALSTTSGDDHKKLRERLAAHFVQRRRPDIAEWKEGNLFPRRETTELTYKLTGTWERFFDAVLDYCASVVAAAGEDTKRQRLKLLGHARPDALRGVEPCGRCPSTAHARGPRR